LNQLRTDLFTAESVGQKEDLKEISADNPKQKTRLWRVFCFFFCFYPFLNFSAPFEISFSPLLRPEFIEGLRRGKSANYGVKIFSYF